MRKKGEEVLGLVEGVGWGVVDLRVLGHQRNTNEQFMSTYMT